MKETQNQSVSLKKTNDPDIHRLRHWSNTLWQWLRYCLVGIANTLVDILILNLLLWRFPTHNAQTLVIYNSLAYTSGAATSFFFNKYWTFRCKQRLTSKEIGRFVVSMSLEILSSNGLVWLISNALHPLIANPTLWANASKLLAVVGNAVLSYLLMRFWIFTSGSQKRPKQPATISSGAARSTRDLPHS